MKGDEGLVKEVMIEDLVEGVKELEEEEALVDKKGE